MDQCDAFQRNGYWKAEKMNICYFKPPADPHGGANEMVLSKLIYIFGLVSQCIRRNRWRAYTLALLLRFPDINASDDVLLLFWLIPKLTDSTTSHHCFCISFFSSQIYIKSTSAKLSVPLLFPSDYGSM